MNRYIIFGFVLVATGVFMTFFSNAKAAVPAGISSNSEFAINLYQKISSSSEDENLFISPYSIYSALALIYAGANDNTKTEFEKALSIQNPSNFHSALSSTVESLKKRDGEGYKIKTANALWLDKDFDVLDTYSELTQKYYGTSENTIDITKPDTSAAKVNKWVADNTENKIKDLVKPKDVAVSKLIITNAVYFKGDWLDPFEIDKTYSADFRPFSGERFQVDMMYKRNKFKYMDAESSEYIELPYKGENLSMIVILPKKEGSDAFKDSESKLAKELLHFIGDQSGDSEIDLLLPKFKVETGTILLNGVLEELGIRDAFHYPAADFSGITGNNELFIGMVLHKAFIEVNEQGTEAAAATAIMMPEGAIFNSYQPKQFKADRPFIYLIRDKKTSMILFIGKMLNPNA